ncbi:MAG: hydantoinase B/oxoprolinase family protein, partial [Candidatus Cybelea sp.]
RHTLRPPGAAGGAPGGCGRHELQRDGETSPLPAKTSFDFRPGDVLTVQTPGGGGYGSEGSVAPRPRGALETEAGRAEKIDDANRAAPR